MLQIFDPTSNFWESNPGYKIPFNRLYSEDKSKKKEESSKIMWSIALLESDKSPYKEASKDERIKLIKDDYYSPDWNNITEEINLFVNLNTSKAKKKLRNWEEKLEERDKFIADTSDLLGKKLHDKYPENYREYGKTPGAAYTIKKRTVK